MDYYVPRIIERKGQGDLTESMRDGRWVSQQAAMADMAKRVGVGCVKMYVFDAFCFVYTCRD